MGGIGKTTLAQSVYANADDHFTIKIWVSVSRKSNIEGIFRDLLGTSFDHHSSLNDILDRLKERLKVGKCLIVLDDVWMDHGIDVGELLKDLLSLTCQGSKILMTMRNTKDIPPMTDCRYIIYQLQVLSKNDCWSIIKKIAFGLDGAKETTDLIDIGKKIAGKCGGGALVKQISDLSLLRVLNLSDTGIKELRHLICNIKHLKYLDHSRTGITNFPISFCHLESLQTLMFKRCNVKELPKDMGRLFSLKHLIFSYNYISRGRKTGKVFYNRIQLTQMPKEVSRCSKLKKLCVFIVGEGKGYGIEELKDLNLLGGKLIIDNLGSATNGKPAELKEKKDITP
ncbi:hypothetical protein C5167_030208 [Papaver somniferum]|nr:hypothetical protein C5167_030208 [Papaver somniferum]